MRSDKNIFVAFILNFAFSIFEIVGGLITGSVAILSDALHDFGDAASIGVSYFLERKSRKKPDGRYTYGYARFSVLGGLITSMILLIGSVAVICNAVVRIFYPTELDYSGMIVFAIVGACVNFVAALFTRGGHSLNQRAINLHMLEDLLGWIVVLVGAIVMKFTDIGILDPLMSIGVAIFILINACKGTLEALKIFLERAPEGVDTDGICEHLCAIEGVIGVHHIHVWSMDGQNCYATLHAVVDETPRAELKRRIREELSEHGVSHVTVELEGEGEECTELECKVEYTYRDHHCHHGHHHGHPHEHH